MSFETLGIPLAYIILGAILLWFILGARGWLWLKMLTITFTIFFGVAVEYSTSTYLGWPSKDDLPNVFLVHWVKVQEPNRKDPNDDGAIFLWVRDINKDNESDSPWYSLSFLNYSSDNKKEPRAYAIPYTKKMHAQANEMTKKLKNGKAIIAGKGAKKFLGKGKEEGKGKGNAQGRGKKGGKNGKTKGGKGMGGYRYSVEQEFQFYELPPPKMPPKDSN